MPRFMPKRPVTEYYDQVCRIHKADRIAGIRARLADRGAHWGWERRLWEAERRMSE